MELDLNRGKQLPASGLLTFSTCQKQRLPEFRFLELSLLEVKEYLNKDLANPLLFNLYLLIYYYLICF